MIKSLSTYNLIVPFVSPLTAATCSQYTLRIYLWDGLIGSVPATPEYELTKINFESSTGNDRVNIARLVNDFIEFIPVTTGDTETNDAGNQVWCKTTIEYFTTDTDDDGVEQSALTQLVLKGYGSGLEGENPQPRADGILIDGNVYRVARGSAFSIPLLLDAAKSGAVKSYPDEEVDYTISESIQTDSSKMVKVLNVVAPSTDEYIEIIIGARNITLIIKDEYKYTPIDIYFVNKHGCQQTITFFKERRDTLKITRESFESFEGNAADGLHQFIDYNTTGRTSIKLTSGYIPEGQNDAIRQLLLSHKVWIYSGQLIPVNITNTSHEFKTRLNDRLISYDIDFNLSYSEINTI